MDQNDLQRALKGLSFIGLSITTGDATHYGNQQLWNPVGSGVILIVRQCVLQSNSGGTAYYFGPSNAEMTRVNWDAVGNKLIGGPGAKAILNADVGADSTVQNHTLLEGWSLLTASGEPVAIPFNEPIIVPAGMGLAVCCQSFAIGSTVTWEWDEIPG